MHCPSTAIAHTLVEPIPTEKAVGFAIGLFVALSKNQSTCSPPPTVGSTLVRSTTVLPPLSSQAVINAGLAVGPEPTVIEKVISAVVSKGGQPEPLNKELLS